MREPLHEQRDFIIEAALTYVPFYGWSWKALERAGVDLADDAMLARRLFTSDLYLAADHFADLSDRRMKTELEKVDLMAMRVRERIHTCVKVRIALNSPNKDAIRCLLSFLSLQSRICVFFRDKIFFFKKSKFDFLFFKKKLIFFICSIPIAALISLILKLNPRSITSYSAGNFLS